MPHPGLHTKNCGKLGFSWNKIKPSRTLSQKSVSQQLWHMFRSPRLPPQHSRTPQLIILTFAFILDGNEMRWVAFACGSLISRGVGPSHLFLTPTVHWWQPLKQVLANLGPLSSLPPPPRLKDTFLFEKLVPKLTNMAKFQMHGAKVKTSDTKFRG